jgi:5-(carboxyamino)imidazole ribonucleotide synthase
MRIGILGAGQLGRMLALSGYPLGHSFVFFDQSPGESTKGIGSTHVAPFSDEAALARFASECDVVTYEFENVPCEAARFLATKVPVYPPPQALEVSQDRVVEKTFLQNLGVATPRFEAASSEQELREACKKVGLPCIAKTRRFGYDGKGQARITDLESVPDVWRALGGSPLIVEGFVQFSRELSVIAARDTHGSIAIYPLAHNDHLDGILHRTEIPAPEITPPLRQEAHTIVTTILEKLNYVGVLTVELFQAGEHLLANEMAPRVHNSGHATIDSCVTSQFESHIRAISGMHVGSTEPRARAVMFNLVGSIPSPVELSAIPDSKIHLYGKSERQGRKVGHITILNPTASTEALLASKVSTNPNH